ncbi:protocadherin gamma-C5-like isoform X10 [Rhinatrema bivittatum]|uniref:protocadherin gamma-C5-like isoform X10 n=1 Tax=Rhinatrema bivittatum TaxID=194408 RepID=UPI001125B827|nr:protocadherin gamma-C5-like isoform X10 [Rhinatrema bivittatum]
MESRSSRKTWKGQVLCSFSLCIWVLVSGQLRYSIVEESEQGTVVGNLAQDLGINVAAISKRRLRLRSESSRRYFAVNVANGALIVNEKIDRESLCGSSSSCLLHVDVVTENPLELFRLQVEILDINDNSPIFLTTKRQLRIAESAAPGSRFPLESAQDPDVGTNAVSSYKLNPTPFFSLSVKVLKDGKLFPEIVLENPVDREEHEQHQLILTAFDGGNPARSGTAQINVIVLDNNDNAPVFDHSVYKVSLLENSPVNTALIKLNATDIDEGLNGEIEYSFDALTSDSVFKIFSLDTHSGEILVKGLVDFEQSNFYEIHVRARDKGVPEMEGHCIVQVQIEDVNDNPPEILITSLEKSVPENTPVGTVVGLFIVRDRDSGKCGEVMLNISPNLPFKFKSSDDHYSLITGDILDREKVSQYTIELIATDLGLPSLYIKTTVVLNVSDINDNPPSFSQPFYNAYIKENNQPGSLLCTVSASDPDLDENSHLTYSIAESPIHDSFISSFVYINSHNGNIYAQRSFDYELLQVLQIPVWVEDGGSPKLRSSITIYVFVLDLNDNSPLILYPATSREQTAQQKISRSMAIDYLITKVTAVDADSGYNAWLSYSLLEPTDLSLFRVAPYTGEIRTIRAFTETDNTLQKILILVRDNGDPALSTTVTILMTLDGQIYEESPQSRDFLTDSKKSDMTLYLIISLVAISVISLAAFVILSIKCLRKEKENFSSLCDCLSIGSSQSRHFIKQPTPTLHINSDGTLKYMEVSMRPADSEAHCYRACFAPVSETSDFMKPLNFPQLRDMVNETDSFSSRDCELSEPYQQAQPNTDWRFSQAQRPGTSGSQNPEEGGAWPNNQLETERLQAMILASANAGPIEAADGSSTLGGAAGTMGLSTRYGPQFTLQHVPDYRQNVYIPGNTATLTNSAGKRDGKGATSSGGNKKKSGKKEKK